jgi:hypothetical protein
MPVPGRTERRRFILGDDAIFGVLAAQEVCPNRTKYAAITSDRLPEITFEADGEAGVEA